MKEEFVKLLGERYADDPYAKFAVDMRGHVHEDYDIIEDIEIPDEYKRIAYKLILSKHVDEVFEARKKDTKD